jgi:type VI secretion system protein ImpF
MSYSDKQPSLMPSLLDRLIDPASGGTAAHRWYAVDDVVAAVHRDLEELLNTRQTHSGLPADFKEMSTSIYCYGLPDLTSLNAITPSQREGIGRLIEGVVANFEPRLQDVHAHLVDSPDPLERTVRFRIDARLNLDPAPEVAFHADLELTTGHYKVSAAS